MRTIALYTAFIILVSMFGCTPKPEHLIIEPFEAVHERFEKHSISGNIYEYNNGRDTVVREYYLVSSDKKKYEHSIDSFACEKMKLRKGNREVYFLYFFHKTEKTNSEYIRKYPKSLDNYSESNDFLYGYEQHIVTNSYPYQSYITKYVYNGSIDTGRESKDFDCPDN